MNQRKLIFLRDPERLHEASAAAFVRLEVGLLWKLLVFL